jgi:lysyl-tRNA synthetase, class II
MNSAQYLQFLRPYALQRLPAKNRAYLRLYDGTRQHGAALRCAQRCLATVTGQNGAKPVVGAEGNDAAEKRSHALAARIEELSRAQALVYPRIQKNSIALPMRIPDFREKYRDVSTENPGDEEIVLHGTVTRP